MSPNVIQRAVAVADLVSAHLSRTNTTCVRQPQKALGIIRDALLDAIITAHLEHARECFVNGNREGFERHCEQADRLARQHAPARLGDVEDLLVASTDRYAASPERQ